MPGLGIGISPFLSSYYGRSGGGFPLNLWPGATLAYSFRQLSSTYNGYCINVVRSSDNAESQFLLLAGWLDTLSVLSFTGVGDGFVSKIYDQSGNVNDFVFASGQRPKIVASGVLVTQGGLPAALFDGVDDFGTLTTPITGDTSWSTFIVSKRRAAATAGINLSGVSVNSNYSAWQYSDNTMYLRGKEGAISLPDNTSSRAILVSVWADNLKAIYKNNVNQAAGDFSVLPVTGDFNALGRRGSDYSDGYFQELIHYSENKQPIAFRLVENQNAAYSVYTGELTVANLITNNGIWVDGNYAYCVAFGGDALQIIDVTDSSNPFPVGNIQSGEYGIPLNGPIGVQVVGDYAFVSCNQSNTVTIINISNKRRPSYVSSVAVGNAPWNLQVVGDYVYVGCNSVFQIINISDIENPVVVGTLANGTGGAIISEATTHVIDGNYAYIANFQGDAIEVVNISDPANPTHVSKIVDGEGGALLNESHGVIKVGNYLYVASRSENAIQVIDVTNPATPTAYSSLVDGEGGAILLGPKNLHNIDNIIYCVNYTGNSLEIINISNPAAITHVGNIADGSGGAALDGANRVYVSGNYAYVASNDSNALEIVNISIPAVPVHASKVLNRDTHQF